MIKRWYHHTSARAPIPLQADIENFAGDYAALYRQEYPTLPGRPVQTHVTYFRVNYNVPSEADFEAAVWKLRLNKAGGRTHLRAEHFKKWMQEAYPDEGASSPPKAGAVEESGGTYTVHLESRGDP